MRRNCPLKHVIGKKKKKEGRIDETGRRGRKYKQTLDDLNESKRYWKSKDDPTAWRIRFERGYGSDIRQTHADDSVKKRPLPSFRYCPNIWTEGLRRNTITLRIIQMKFSDLISTILRFQNIPASYHAINFDWPLKPRGKYAFCLNS